MTAATAPTPTAVGAVASARVAAGPSGVPVVVRDPRDRVYRVELDIMAGMTPFWFRCAAAGCEHERVAGGRCWTHQEVAS